MQEMKFIKLTIFFLENPYQEVYLRELAKKLRISPFAVKKYSELLIKEGLILEERKANLRYFKANVNNLFYRKLKIALNIQRLQRSELVEYIKEHVANLSSLVLFGSLAKGTDDEKSDVDLLVIGKEKHLDMREFKEKLDKEVRIHFFSWSEWNRKAKADHPFYYEVISNGVPLYGELPLTKWK